MCRFGVPLLAIPLLAAAGCSTDAAVSEDFLTVAPLGAQVTQGEGELDVMSYLPASPEHPLRVKANGRYLAYDNGGHLQYLEILGTGAGIGAVLPTGAYEIELVDGDGNRLVKTDPIAVRARPATLEPSIRYGSWVMTYPTAGEAGALLGDPLADDDPATIEVHVRNAADASLLAVRCVADSCENYTTLATIAPGETWSAKLPAPGGYDSAGGLGVRFANDGGGTSRVDLLPNHPCRDVAWVVVVGGYTVRDAAGNVLGRDITDMENCPYY